MSLNLTKKLEILKKLKNGVNISSLAKEYNVARSTISRIKKHMSGLQKNFPTVVNEKDSSNQSSNYDENSQMFDSKSVSDGEMVEESGVESCSSKSVSDSESALNEEENMISSENETDDAECLEDSGQLTDADEKDPNDLCDTLRVLISSNGLDCRSRAIISELRRTGCIE